MKREKQLLRTKFKHIRNQISSHDIAQHSERIVHELIKTDDYKEAVQIFAYMSMLSEVDTFAFIQKALDHGKIVAIPKIDLLDNKRIMHFYRLEHMDDVAPGYYDVLEPISNEFLTPQDGDLIMVPGLVFSKSGYRIGYGGGYYDKFLSTYQHVHLSIIGLAHECQLVDQVVHEFYDMKIPMIITEKQIYKLKRS